jgi:SulP family sulfate permease
LREIRLHADPPLTGLILSMEGVNFIDTEGSDTLKKIAQVGQELEIDFHLARPKPQVLEVLQRDDVIDLIGAEHIHADIAAAVELHMSKHAPDAQNQPPPQEPAQQVA